MEAARRNADLTQAEIALKMGISRDFYHRLETGKADPKPAYILAFCKITGFELDDIILPKVTTK